MRCLRCNHPLRSPGSILRGLGPVCAGKDDKTPSLFAEAAFAPAPRADFFFHRGPSGLLEVTAGAGA